MKWKREEKNLDRIQCKACGVRTGRERGRTRNVVVIFLLFSCQKEKRTANTHILNLTDWNACSQIYWPHGRCVVCLTAQLEHIWQVYAACPIERVEERESERMRERDVFSNSFVSFYSRLLPSPSSCYYFCAVTVCSPFVNCDLWDGIDKWTYFIYACCILCCIRIKDNRGMCWLTLVFDKLNIYYMSTYWCYAILRIAHTI